MLDKWEDAAGLSAEALLSSHLIVIKLKYAHDLKDDLNIKQTNVFIIPEKSHKIYKIIESLYTSNYLNG